MFLFLSKLLPLFVYPLGLASAALIVALIVLRRRPRLAAVAIVAALALLVVGGNRWFALWLTRSLERRYVPSAPLPRADAIVVLGGGTQPAFPPQPWVHLTEPSARVVYAAKLYRDGRAPLVILSGGGTSGSPEAAAMAEVLRFVAVPDTAIIQETESLNTYQNALYVRKILDARGLHRILLVTSAAHMPRAMMMFRRQGIDAIAAPADFIATDQYIEQTRDSLNAIVVNLIPDAESLDWTSRALKEYLGLAAYSLAGLL
jgi:uncharacterized SAM-binding protein YcdF (DUF218 family)